VINSRCTQRTTKRNLTQGLARSVALTPRVIRYPRLLPLKAWAIAHSQVVGSCNMPAVTWAEAAEQLGVLELTLRDGVLAGIYPARDPQGPRPFSIENVEVIDTIERVRLEGQRRCVACEVWHGMAAKTWHLLHGGHWHPQLEVCRLTGALAVVDEDLTDLLEGFWYGLGIDTDSSCQGDQGRPLDGYIRTADTESTLRLLKRLGDAEPWVGDCYGESLADGRFVLRFPAAALKEITLALATTPNDDGEGWLTDE
jgi:hypothetical protein